MDGNGTLTTAHDRGQVAERHGWLLEVLGGEDALIVHGWWRSNPATARGARSFPKAKKFSGNSAKRDRPWPAVAGTGLRQMRSLPPRGGQTGSRLGELGKTEDEWCHIDRGAACLFQYATVSEVIGVLTGLTA